MMCFILFKHLEPFQFDRMFYFKASWEVKLTSLNIFLLLNLFISTPYQFISLLIDFSCVISWNI